MNIEKQKGFSLIELIIVVAVVAIIAAIALPSYNNYVIRTKRADGMAAMLSAVQAIERQKANNNFSYVGASLPFTTIPADATGADTYYSLALTNLTATTYTITATGTNSMSGKDFPLSINQSGAKTWGSHQCWPESGNSC